DRLREVRQLLLAELTARLEGVGGDVGDGDRPGLPARSPIPGQVVSQQGPEAAPQPVSPAHRHQPLRLSFRPRPARTRAPPRPPPDPSPGRPPTRPRTPVAARPAPSARAPARGSSA